MVDEHVAVAEIQALQDIYAAVLGKYLSVNNVLQPTAAII